MCVFNLLSPGRRVCYYESVIFKYFYCIFCASYKIVVKWIPQNSINDKGIGSGNGWEPSSNKSLAEPVLTKIADIIWRH